jgi:hypothetical protein
MVSSLRLGEATQDHIDASVLFVQILDQELDDVAAASSPESTDSALEGFDVFGLVDFLHDPLDLFLVVHPVE